MGSGVGLRALVLLVDGVGPLLPVFGERGGFAVSGAGGEEDDVPLGRLALFRDEVAMGGTVDADPVDLSGFELDGHGAGHALGVVGGFAGELGVGIAAAGPGPASVAHGLVEGDFDAVQGGINIGLHGLGTGGHDGGDGTGRLLAGLLLGERGGRLGMGGANRSAVDTMIVRIRDAVVILLSLSPNRCSGIGFCH